MTGGEQLPDDMESMLCDIIISIGMRILLLLILVLLLTVATSVIIVDKWMS